MEFLTQTDEANSVIENPSTETLLDSAVVYDLQEDNEVPLSLKTSFIDFKNHLHVTFSEQIMDVKKLNIYFEDQTTIVVTGDYVTFSDFLFDEMLHRPVFKKFPFHKNVQTIKVFATEKIVVDRNVYSSDSSLNFIIIAPLWEVVGEMRRFVMTATKQFCSSEWNQSEEDGNDANGLERKRGQSGGHFVGFFEKIVGGVVEISSIVGIKDGKNGGDSKNRTCAIKISGEHPNINITCKYENNGKEDYSSAAVSQGQNEENLEFQKPHNSTPIKQTQFGKYLPEYKEFVRKTKNDISQQFLTYLETRPEITTDFVTATTLAQDLLELELHSLKLTDCSHKHYTHIQDRMLQFIELKWNICSPLEKKLINAMVASTVSKLMHLNSKEQDVPMVINVHSCLKGIEREMKRLKKGISKITLLERCVDFQQHIDSKIERLNFLIKTDVEITMKDLIHRLVHLQSKAFAELNGNLDIAKANLRGKTQAHESDLKVAVIKSILEYKPYFQAIQAVRFTIESGFAVISAVIPAAGPFVKFGEKCLRKVEPSIGAIEKGFNSLDEAPKSEAVTMTLTTFRNTPQAQLYNDIRTALFQINVLEKEISENNLLKEREDMNAEISSFKLVIVELKTMAKNPLCNFCFIIDNLKTKRTNLRKFLKIAAENFEHVDKCTADKLRRLVVWLLSAEHLDQQGCEKFYHEVLATIEAHALQMAISEAKDQVSLVKSRMQDVKRGFQPAVENFISFLRTQCTSEAATTQRKLATEFKYFARKTLRIMETELNGLVEGLKISRDVEMCLIAMKDALKMLTEIYEQIEKNEEAKGLASLIKNVGGTSEDGNELSLLISKLDFLRRNNELRIEFERALLAVKQWSFPYAYKYQSESNCEFLTEEIEGVLSKDVDSKIWNAFDNIAEYYLQEVETLSEKVEKSETEITEEDETWILQDFTSEHTQPFYSWENKKWGSCIEKLFKGEDVMMKSDVVLNVHNGKAAIKFKTVELNIKHKYSSKQSELDEILSEFKVTMSHSGMSYYSVLDRVYVINTSKRNFTYAFKRNHAEEKGKGYEGRVGYSLACEKLENGSNNILLSPYTLWTFQLSLENSDKKQLWESLAEYAPHVELELRGKGIYVDEKAVSKAKNFYQLEEAQLGKYYERV